MNLTVHIPGFGQMFGVPNAVVDQYLKLATPSQLKVLLYLLRTNGQTVDHSEIAKALAISEELVEEAALFWSQTDLFAVTEPAAESVPVTEAADSVPAGGISWEYALSQLENELPIGVRIVLTDATQSSGEIRGSELILHLLPGFAKNAVNVPDVLNKIRQKVSALCGAPMQIRLEELQSGGAQGEDKLDFLGKFGNVTIQ